MKMGETCAAATFSCFDTLNIDQTFRSQPRQEKRRPDLNLDVACCENLQCDAAMPCFTSVSVRRGKLRQGLFITGTNTGRGGFACHALQPLVTRGERGNQGKGPASPPTSQPPNRQLKPRPPHPSSTAQQPSRRICKANPEQCSATKPCWTS